MKYKREYYDIKEKYYDIKKKYEKLNLLIGGDGKGNDGKGNDGKSHSLEVW